MKTKNVTITFRIRPTNADALIGFLEEYQSGSNELIALHVADVETGKIEASYENEYGELKASFHDVQMAEGMIEHALECLTDGRGIYLCYPGISDIRREGNKLNVDLHIEMPWYTENVPEEPLSPQLEYLPSGREPQEVHYKSCITGIRHCMNEEKYQDFENRVMHREEIVLKPEPENPYDSNAIAAYTTDGMKAGYIPKEETGMISKLMKEEGFKATLYYMDFMAGSAQIEITVNTGYPLYVMKLFSRYTPIEVCRANYLYRRWGGIPEKEEAGIFSNETLSMDFEKFSALDVMYQDRLAQTWEERMEKATVENPDFPGARMNVPLDLSVYGTDWKSINLQDTCLLDKIELENKVLAIYIRMRRKGIAMSPEECNEQAADGNLTETVLKRMHFIYDNKRL